MVVRPFCHVYLINLRASKVDLRKHTKDSELTKKVAQEKFTAWGPFLERPGNLTGPKTYFEIKVSWNVGCVPTSNEVHFVSLADNFPVPFSKLLKLPSLMENKTA